MNTMERKNRPFDSFFLEQDQVNVGVERCVVVFQVLRRGLVIPCVIQPLQGTEKQNGPEMERRNGRSWPCEISVRYS